MVSLSKMNRFAFNSSSIFIAFLFGIVVSLFIFRIFDSLLLSSSSSHIKNLSLKCNVGLKVRKSLEQVDGNLFNRHALSMTKDSLKVACIELSRFEDFLITKGLDKEVIRAKIRISSNNDSQ